MHVSQPVATYLSFKGTDQPGGKICCLSISSELRDNYQILSCPGMNRLRDTRERGEFAQRTVTTRQKIGAEMVSNMSRYNPTWDLEVYRNVTIQRTAEAMKEIDRLV